jgi:hypothetical protein
VASFELGRLGKDDKRLGAFNFKLIEFLNKMSYCFGNEIRNVFNESDIYTILLNVMVSFPLNDIALQQVKIIFDHIIGNPFIKEDEVQQKICHDIMLEVINKSNMIETIICQAKTTEYLGKAYFNRLGQ